MASGYITTAGSDHTIVVPPNIPVGATVAVIVLPTDAGDQNDAARSARFRETLAAIQAASAPEGSQVVISDEELAALVERACKA